jgi:hypothetical protein
MRDVALDYACQMLKERAALGPPTPLSPDRLRDSLLHEILRLCHARQRAFESPNCEMFKLGHQNFPVLHPPIYLSRISSRRASYIKPYGARFVLRIILSGTI